jgi:hypothetical protein
MGGVGEGGGHFPPTATRHIPFRPRGAQVDRLSKGISFTTAVIHVYIPVNKNNTEMPRVCPGYAAAKSYLVSLNDGIFVLTPLHQNVVTNQVRKPF